MVKKQDKRQRNIKAKLMAAICMLLVSSILMVSTTYAWFTLSTAPEVTGITTAVGANGNLEMALQPLSGDSSKIESSQGDSMYGGSSVYDANTTWGNLVDVSDSNYYGLNKITLYPAALNTTEGVDKAGNAITKLATAPLTTPEYGADGRITKLEASTFTGVYSNGGFTNTIAVTNNGTVSTLKDPNGVRAVGTSSGMSDRQLAYRAALSAASTAASQAKRVASQSLNNNGAALADIAIKHATFTATTSEPTETYTVAELESLLTIVNELQGYDTGTGDSAVHTTGSLEYIEEALIQYALAMALANIATDDNYATYVTAFEGATLDTLAEVMSGYGVNSTLITAEKTGLIALLQKSNTNVAEAYTSLSGLVEAGQAVEWATISPALQKLADPSAMQVNGIKVDQLKGNWKFETGETLPDGYYVADGTGEKPGETGYVYDDKGVIVSNMARLVDAVLNDGIQLIIASGAGVYADIADFCGDYSASVTLSQISYGGLTVRNLDANMATRTNQTTPYLTQASTAVPEYSAGASSSASTNITDFYGYIIDLAFRTNVADSYLQLQTEAVDRIYSDGTNTGTMGHGASMSFTATSDTFSGVAVKSLMECIRVVFFDTDSGKIIGYARLDASSAETDSSTGKITMDLVMTAADGTATGSANIMALEQNTIHELSVLVYLDGADVTNADVANAASSMTGSMNLQFSSSSELTPMDYSDLKAGDSNTTITTGSLKTVTTTVTSGYNATTYYYNGAIGAVITDTTGNVITSGVTVTIGGKTATYGTVGSYSAWVVAADAAPTDTVAITVTTN